MFFQIYLYGQSFSNIAKNMEKCAVHLERFVVACYEFRTFSINYEPTCTLNKDTTRIHFGKITLNAHT